MGRHSGHPRYRLHKSTGQAIVSFPEPFKGKRFHYLGPFGTRQTSPESWEKYDRLIAEWLLSRHDPRAGVELCKGEVVSVNRLVDAYLTHAEQHYRKRGNVTDQYHRIESAVRPLLALYGSTPAAEFGKDQLAAVRQRMIEQDWSRGFINSCVGCLKAMFDWGTPKLVPPAVAHELRTFKPLRKNAPGVKETRKIRPVPLDHVNRTLPHLPPVVADMVRVQLLADMRPIEVCHLRRRDINFAGFVEDVGRFPGVWAYEVSDDGNKLAHRDLRRVVLFGPQAMKVLKPYIKGRAPDAYLFSPRESAQRFCRETGRAYRPGRKREPGERYTTDTYGNAIERACARAGVPRWAPNRLRKTKATEVLSRFGPLEVQALLGHAGLDVVSTYAFRDLKRASEVMKEIG
jgi:integrase